MYIGQVFNEKNCDICSELYTPNSSRQKFCSSCTITHRASYKKQWRLANKVKDNETKKKWYWNNVEKARAVKRKWNWSEGGVEYRKKYAQEHKETIYTRLKKYKARNDSRSKANYLIKKWGWERVCAVCGSIERVQIHHIDGDPFNNEKENLTLLCLVHHKLKHHHKI